MLIPETNNLIPTHKNRQQNNSMGDLEYTSRQEIHSQAAKRTSSVVRSSIMTYALPNRQHGDYEEEIAKQQTLLLLKNLSKVPSDFQSVANTKVLPETNNQFNFSFNKNKEDTLKKLEDKIERELDSDNFLYVNYDLIEKEKKSAQKQEQNEIKKLNLWDQEHIENPIQFNKSNQKLLKLIKKGTIKRSIALRREMESINSLNVIKESISKLNMTFNNKKFQEFANRADKEQGTILLQNIAVSKRKFNFDVFSRNEKSAIENDLNMDFKEIRDETINVDYYRQIIKEKSRLEAKYRRELMEVAQKIFEKKIEKQKLEDINGELFKELYNCRKEHDSRKDKLDAKLLFLNKQYNGTINAIQNESKNFSMAKVFSVKVSQKYEQEERMKLSNNYTKKLELIEQESNELKLSYESVRGKFDVLVEENRQNILLIEQEIMYLKSIFNNSVKDQRLYYLEILGKGIDVRGEGLVWVVKRLIEIEMPLEYNQFPKFIDHGQVDYLIKLAGVQIHSSQMKILLKSLKTRQKLIREQEGNEFIMRSTKMGQNSNNNSKQFTSRVTSRDPNPSLNNQIINNFNKSYLSDKTMSHFKSTFQKYQIPSKNEYDQKLEDIQVKSIVESLKEKILEYSKNEKVFEEIEKSSSNNNTILKYFLEHEKQREYFEEILLLRNQIQLVDEYIEKIVKDEKKSFQKRYDQFKNVNPRSSVQYDILYAAMFGNNISV